MKNTLLAAVLMTELLSVPAAASLTEADFPSCSDVSGPFEKGILYQVHLAREIMERSANGFSDLRMLDGKNSEVPRVILEERFPAGVAEVYSLEITGYEKNGSSSIATMKLPERHRPVSMLVLEIPDRDFRKQVIVESGTDGRTWHALAETDIYDFSREVKLRKTTVQFTPTGHRYFRLTFKDRSRTHDQEAMRLRYQGLDFTVAGAAGKEISIRRIEGRTAADSERPSIYDEQTSKDFTIRTDENGDSIVQFGSGLPLDRITMDIADPYYYRETTLFSSETGQEGSYQVLARQPIYRFPLSADRQETNNSFVLRTGKHALYRMELKNKNDAPLALRGVVLSWIRRDLYFIAPEAAERYVICFGNTALSRPEYDLERFITQASLPQQRFEQRTAGPLRENAGFVAQTPRERKAKMEKIALTGVVLFLVAGMGYWLYRLMRRGPKSGQ